MDLSLSTGISDLSFVRCLCPRLISLNVSYTRVSDLSPLAEFCPNLKHLDISNTPAIDITPLTSLRELETVAMNEPRSELATQIPIVLGSLRNLRRVSLSGNEFYELSFLLPSKATLEEVNIERSRGMTIQKLQMRGEFKALRALNMAFI